MEDITDVDNRPAKKNNKYLNTLKTKILVTITICMLEVIRY